MKKLGLILLLLVGFVSELKANDLAPVAVITPNPDRTWFYNAEEVVFDLGNSYVPNGYIINTKWYINGVYQSLPNYFDLSVCFVLSDAPVGNCYQLASGQTTVQIKLEVQSNHGYWDEKTITYTIKEHKGRKYFIKDHLGSIRTTVNREGNVLGYDDYYPFGLAMPGRSSNSANPNDNYKFTGYENEDEAGMTLYHAGNRMYDPVLGRFMQIDRYYHKYPSMSTYQYAANNPLYFIDVNGDSIWVNQGKNSYLYVDGTLYNKDGSEYTGKVRGFLKQTVNALDKIREGGDAGSDLITTLQDATTNTNISYTSGKNEIEVRGRNRNISWNPSRTQGGLDENGNLSRPSFLGLAHELGHSYSTLDGTWNTSPWYTGSDGNIKTQNEVIGVHWENRIRAEHGLPLRGNYEQFDNPDSRTLIPGTRYSPHLRNNFEMYRYRGGGTTNFMDMYYRHLRNL